MSLRSTVGAALRAVGLGRVGEQYRAYEVRKAARVAAQQWRVAVLDLISDDSRPTLVAGALDDGAIPVIVCMWTRPDRLTAILDQLSSQDGVRVRLLMWNNRPENTPAYLAEFAERGVSGSLASIEFFNSERNIGGMARFVVAHKIVLDGYSGPFITFDDDQDVSSRFLSDLMSHYAPDTCAGWWAWTYTDNYWEREPAKPGEQATYVGTPGAVFDTSVVADRAFFERIPARYGFIEDVWSSYWVSSQGGKLRKVETESDFVQLELNQYHALIDKKTEFGRYLIKHPNLAKSRR